jgi:hypothetical protein
MCACFAMSLLLAAAPRPTKVAVQELEAGLGTDPKLAHLVTTLTVSELRKLSGLTVTSQEDIKNLLGFAKQREMLQCSDAACLAEIGGALGVDQMVTGSLSRLGQSLVLVLRAVDVHKAQVLHDVTRRAIGAQQERLLDLLPGAVAELYPGHAPALASAPAAAVTGSVPQARHRSSAPWWLAGAGAVVAVAGVVIASVEYAAANPQGHPSGVTTYSIPYSQAEIGTGGEVIGGVGLAVLAGGIAWAVLRSSSPQ